MDLKTIKSLERRFKFVYLPHNLYENKKDILSRGLAEFQNGRVSKEAIELGKKFRHEVLASFFAPSMVKRIDKQVGCGLFASERLEARCFFGQYTGLVRRNDRRYFEPLNNYCYEYPVPDSIGRAHVIDATQGNLARFINHSYTPNLKPIHVYIDGFFYMIFVTLRVIELGEQLCYDYGPHYWYLRSKPVALCDGF